MSADVISTTFRQLIADGVLQIGDGHRAKLEELGGDGLIFLRAGNVSDDAISFDDVERFHTSLAQKIAQKVSRPGDTIITTKGNSTGRTSYVTEVMPSFVYSPHLSFWRSKQPNQLHPGFLRYWARGEEFQEQLRGMMGSTDMAPYLSLTDQEMLKITVPAMNQQSAIARILGALDEKIELNRRMNRTLEALAKKLFKSWFVDFDPVVAKSEGRKPFGLSDELATLFPYKFDESEQGPIPRGWVVAPLDSLAEFRNGLAMQKFPPGPGESLPVLKIAELRAGSTLSADRASIDLDPRFVVDDGDLIFSWSGSLLVDVWAGGKAALNQHLFKVIPNGVPQWFCHQWLLEHLDDFQGIAADKATTMGHIRRHHLTDAKIVRPSEALLQELDRVIAPLAARQLQNKLQMRKLAALRDLLLPKLLSGEIRVGAAERVVEEVT